MVRAQDHRQRPRESKQGSHLLDQKDRPSQDGRRELCQVQQHGWRTKTGEPRDKKFTTKYPRSGIAVKVNTTICVCRTHAKVFGNFSLTHVIQYYQYLSMITLYANLISRYFPTRYGGEYERCVPMGLHLNGANKNEYLPNVFVISVKN